MNEAYEVELKNLTASFLPSPFDLILGVEQLTILVVDEGDNIQGFTDVEWQIVYCRVLVDDRWFFLPQTWYDEIDADHGELIGDKLWELTNRIK